MRKQSVTKENIAAGIVCTAPWRLSKVKPLPNYELENERDKKYETVIPVFLIMGGIVILKTISFVTIEVLKKQFSNDFFATEYSCVKFNMHL